MQIFHLNGCGPSPLQVNIYRVLINNLTNKAIRVAGGPNEDMTFHHKKITETNSTLVFKSLIHIYVITEIFA